MPGRYATPHVPPASRGDCPVTTRPTQYDPSGMELLKLKDRALASAVEGITIADALLPDRPLTYVNEGFLRLTGYTLEETVGFNCRFLQGPDTDPEAVKEIRAAIAEERYCEVELLNYRKDGTPFWNNLSITPVQNELGKTTHFVGIQSDVTRQHVAEERLLKANADLLAANRRMQSDLQAAAKIQQSLLPAPSTDYAGLQLGWSLLPCDELAGDILDIFHLDERRLAFYVLDVCGHGVQAALLSTTLSRWLSLMPLTLKSDPVAVLEHLNDKFQMDGQSAQFFTMCYAVVDLDKLQLKFSSAGHPPPIHLSRDQIQEVSLFGFPIGVVTEPEYELSTIQLSPGDRVFAFSDGVVEQIGRDNQPFGTQRLMQELFHSRQASLQTSIDTTIESLLNSTSDRKNLDDVSMIGIAVLDPQQPSNDPAA